MDEHFRTAPFERNLPVLMGLIGLWYADFFEAQAAAVVRRFGLAGRSDPFARCSRCNGPVQPVAKAAVAARIPPKTALWLDEYHLCPECDQLYWKGTHVLALTGRLEKILSRFDGEGRLAGRR